ncbi:MAG: Virginiamycin B lyase [Candidatus Cybelea sp.]
MTIRALIAAATAVSLLSLWGCSQGTSAVPSGLSPTGAAHFAGSPLVLPPLRYFDTPSTGAWPENIVRGPQHALWFTEEFTDKIGRIASDGTMTEFSISNGQEPEGITEGADGNLWFTEPGANAIGRMTPTGTVTIFPIDGQDPDPRGITLGPDGNVWYTEYTDGYIGRVTPKGKITRFAISGYLPSPWDITAGPGGDLWFTESFANEIGRFDPRTLIFKSSLNVPTGASTPWGILFAPDKHIWFTERTGDKIAEVDGKTIREHKIAQSGSYPEKLASGSDGDLWFPESQAGDIGHIDPASGKFGQVIVLPSGDIPQGIASGFNRNVFFTIASYHNPSQISEVMLR